MGRGSRGTVAEAVELSALTRGRRRWRMRVAAIAMSGGLILLSVFVAIFFGPLSVLPMSGGVLLNLWGFAWPILFIVSIVYRPKPWLATTAPAEEAGSGPLISILAPARNEEPVAEKLVRTYLDQDYANWQLLVIANNCTDKTAEVARWAAGGDPRVVVLECTFENGMKSDALNYALDFVNGDVILEMDADNHLPQGYLKTVADAFRDERVHAVQTQIRAGNARDNLLAAWQDLEFLAYSEVWNRGRATVGLPASIGGTGFAIRPEALKVVGGWHRELVEDFELHTRLVEKGIHVDYLGSATIYDEKPLSWSALINQRKRWVRGHLEVAVRRLPSKDRLGFMDELYLYSPALVAVSLFLFGLGYASLLFPGKIAGYLYFSPWIWFGCLLITFSATTAVAVRSKAWHLVPLVAPYVLFFTFHWVLVLLSAITPVRWSKTKTVHGVQAKKGLLPWLGFDTPQSTRVAAVVGIIAVAWLAPLVSGLRFAPSAFEAPLLQAGRPIAIAIAGAAGVSQGVVQGSVHDQYQKPIASATVTISNTLGVVARGRSNADGDFLMGQIQPGHYTVTVSSTGYQPASTEFDMPASGGVWVTATLALKGGGVIVMPIPY